MTFFWHRYLVLKLYRRPKRLDERTAESATVMLDCLLFLNVVCSPIFYAVQATKGRVTAEVALDDLIQELNEIPAFHQRWHFFLWYLFAAYANDILGFGFGYASAIGFGAGLSLGYFLEHHPVLLSLAGAGVASLLWKFLPGLREMRRRGRRQPTMAAERTRYQEARDDPQMRVHSYRFHDKYPPKSPDTIWWQLHPKARSQDNPSYPQRQRVPDDSLRWDTEFIQYNPPFWEHNDVTKNSHAGGWADPARPDDSTTFTITVQQSAGSPTRDEDTMTESHSFDQSFVKELRGRTTYCKEGALLSDETDGELLRNAHTMSSSDGRSPVKVLTEEDATLEKDATLEIRNPVGRTGLCGRGLLGKWGPNKAAGVLSLDLSSCRRAMRS